LAGPAWSDEEKDVLRRLYGKVSNREILKVLKNRSVHSIQRKANHLGLYYPKGGEIDYEYLKKLNEIVKGEDIKLGEK